MRLFILLFASILHFSLLGGLTDAFAQGSLKDLALQQVTGWDESVGNAVGGGTGLEGRLLKRAEHRIPVYPLLLPGESIQNIAYHKAFQEGNKKLLESLTPEKAAQWARHHLWIELDIAKSKVVDSDEESHFAEDLKFLKSLSSRRVIELQDFSCRIRDFYRKTIKEQEVRELFVACPNNSASDQFYLFDIRDSDIAAYKASLRTPVKQNDNIDSKHKNNRAIMKELSGLAR